MRQFLQFLTMVALSTHALPSAADVGALALSPASDPLAGDLPEGATATGQGAPRTVRCTYEQCAQRAIQHSPLVKAAGLTLDLYLARAREAKAAGYPKLSAEGFATVVPDEKENTEGETPVTSYDWSPSKLRPLLYGSLHVVQPLYTFGKLAILKRLAVQGVDVGRATRRIAQDEARYQVARAWWALVLIAEMSEMIEEGKSRLVDEQARLERMRDESDEKYNQADLLKLHMTAADFEDKVRLTERTRMQAQDGLRIAMAEAVHTVIEPDAESLQPLEFPILPVEAYEALALINHPKLLAMRSGTTARLEMGELARANLWPDIGLVAHLAGAYVQGRDTEPSSIVNNPNAGSYAGIGLSWNPDLFRSLGRLAAARMESRTTTLQEQGERDKTRLEVRQLWRELVDARAMIAVHGQAAKSARGWLHAEQQMHEDGFQVFEEVLKAIEAYYRRKLAHLEAIYTHNVAVAALSRAVGVDVVTAGGTGPRPGK